MPNRGDTLALLSSNSLGTEYIVFSDHSNGNASIYIYGTQNDTNVHVYKRNISSDNLGNGAQIEINKYELSAQSTILLIPSLNEDALTISADKPVAVMAVCDNRNTSVDENKTLSGDRNEGDFTWEMLSPSSLWGTEFILVTPSVTEEIHLKIAGKDLEVVRMRTQQ